MLEAIGAEARRSGSDCSLHFERRTVHDVQARESARDKVAPVARPCGASASAQYMSRFQVGSRDEMNERAQLMFASIAIQSSGTESAGARTRVRPMSRSAIVRVVVLITALAALTVAFALNRSRAQAATATTAHE